MSKYDKELQTGTPEYEEATKPLQREQKQDDDNNDQPREQDEKRDE